MKAYEEIIERKKAAEDAIQAVLRGLEKEIGLCPVRIDFGRYEVTQVGDSYPRFIVGSVNVVLEMQ